MLTKWGIDNFKCLKKVILPLAPLTVLTGTNSSGKSSFIQSILLIAQTIRNSISSRELVLNGPLVQLGSFKDIQAYNLLFDECAIMNKEPIGFCFEFVKKPPVDVPIYAKFSNFFLFTPLEDEPRLQLFEVEQYGVIEGKHHLTAKVSGERNKISDGNLEFDFDYNDISDGEYTLSSNDIREDKKLILHHFLPDESLVGYMYKREQMPFDEFVNAEWDSRVFHCGISLDLQDQRSDMNKMYEEYVRQINLYNNSVDDGPERGGPRYKTYKLSPFKDIISSYFSSNIKYLGPLRFLDSNYPISLADDPKDVGIKGEYTAAVIDEFRKKQIEYISPPSEERTVKKGKFYDALISWLKYLGVAEDIRCSKELENNGYTLRVKISTNDKARNLTRVGTGVSQLLPILTMCLLAESGDTLIIEEPDQHLHPKIQSRLVDFFIAMSQLNRQCIIETHSDHFIDMLRLRISESLLEKNEKIKNNTKIYYFNKHGTEIGTESDIKEIEINKYADYNIWPDGFFDENHIINEKILRNINKKMFHENNDMEEPDD